MTENFLPGRLSALRRFTEYVSRRREFWFYLEARQDGLVSRTDIVGNKIIERFVSRSDSLSYRSISVHKDATSGSTKPHYTLPFGESAGDLVVRKMTVKFARQDSQHVENAISKRTYYVQNGHIRTQYHYNQHCVTRLARIHVKERIKLASTSCRIPCLQILEKQISGPTMASQDLAQRRINMLMSDDGTVVADSLENLQSLLSAERDCLTEVRRCQLEMLELLKSRRKEEATVVVDPPIYKCAREHSCRNALEDDDDSLVAADSLQVDYLTPFLQCAQSTSFTGYDEAQFARNSCLRSLKERLVERANIIMTRLNDENARLAKRQAT